MEKEHLVLPMRERKTSCKRVSSSLRKSYVKPEIGHVEIFPGYRSTCAEASPTRESVTFPGTPRVSSVPGLVIICLEGTKEAG